MLLKINQPDVLLYIRKRMKIMDAALMNLKSKIEIDEEG